MTETKLPRGVRYDPFRERFVRELPKALAFEAGELHMALYGLQNPFVQEAIRLGAYAPWCLACKGARRVRLHPGMECYDLGYASCGRPVGDGGPDHLKACPECEGKGLQPEIPACKSDLLEGDWESARVAGQLGFEIHRGRKTDPKQVRGRRG